MATIENYKTRIGWERIDHFPTNFSFSQQIQPTRSLNSPCIELGKPQCLTQNQVLAYEQRLLPRPWLIPLHCPSAPLTSLLWYFMLQDPKFPKHLSCSFLGLGSRLHLQSISLLPPTYSTPLSLERLLENGSPTRSLLQWNPLLPLPQAFSLGSSRV